ncbi:MAG: hypothetical protein AB7W28_03195 [Armatimonadota bacterium]
MHQIELLVRLKIPDVTALTTINVLRRRMGYAEILDKLDRADYYLFEVEAASEEEACEIVRKLAAHTSLFANPNKHVFEVRPWRPNPRLSQHDGVYEVNCFVRSLDFDPGPGLVASLHKIGQESVRSLTTGTLWTLHLRVEDEAQARSIADEIAVTRSRSRGILMNPHYQICQVF